MIQSKKSNRCGAYCYMFIEGMTKGMSYLDFIQLFKNNGSLDNDEILLSFVLLALENVYYINKKNIYIYIYIYN